MQLTSASDIGSTAEEAKLQEERAALARKRRERFLRMIDARNLDMFGYEPDYTFPGYRSIFGTFSSLLLAVCVLLRISTLTWDFIYPTAIISENRLLFPHDQATGYPLPTFGLVFKRTGWRPFYDPTYFTFVFRQGLSGRASNSTYSELGNVPCSFVDAHGRIIEDEARCPALPSEVLGNFFDARFRFVHVSISRCHNGTDSQGRAVAGPCRRPDEIDALIAQGTITLALAQSDLDPGSNDEYRQLLLIKRQFTVGVHATYDLYFTVRSVTIQPRAYFDSLDTELTSRNFVVLDKTEASFTDYVPERLGKWSQPDPSYVPQYAAFFLMLGAERVDQQRKLITAFELAEAWGASMTFFYLLFACAARRYNRAHFLQQVKGLDLRDLARDQFDRFGRLVDRSFQMPRELQDMHNVANVR